MDDHNSEGLRLELRCLASRLREKQATEREKTTRRRTTTTRKLDTIRERISSISTTDTFEEQDTQSFPAFVNPEDVDGTLSVSGQSKQRRTQVFMCRLVFKPHLMDFMDEYEDPKNDSRVLEDSVGGLSMTDMGAAFTRLKWCR
ncbi:hypothetical protein diail_3552, partial [Diaporthe ilicicola]